MSTRPQGRRYFLSLSLAALGVVFGDIGTSPLYALKESLSPAHGVTLGVASVLGVLSLITWSLVLVVTVKYLVFVLRADNQGEGGILALLALIHSATARRGAVGAALVVLGLFGAALLYGDGILTPAVSVLSAMEGLKLVAPAFEAWVIPLTLAVLVGLFLVQRHGTAVVGRFFGPVTLVWFLVLAGLGVRGVLMEPSVLAAVNPLHGVRFVASNPGVGFFVLGAVFLAVTGAEALYADMGHFGRGPIRFAWLVLVLPALLLNYYGQGGLLLSDASALDNPFYLLAPAWALVPMVILATMATIIASQAIISGAFSLTMQAVQLGYWPRLEVRHTSEREMGQIYVPVVNWALLLGTVWLVVTFRTSSALAAAYGIAVSSTMVITTILLYYAARHRWGWRRAPTLALVACFLAVELVFLAANMTKLLAGGWLPLVIAGSILFLMLTWQEGRRLLGARLRETSRPMRDFLADLQARAPTRVRGNAIYMTGNTGVAPGALVKNLEHNRVLHMRVVLLSITTEARPYVPREERVWFEAIGSGIHRAEARYGFMDEPDAVDVLRLLSQKGLHLPLMETTFFLGRERIVSTSRPGMSRWRELVFGFMSQNSRQATAYFRIPPDRVIEVGSQVEL